MTETIIERDSLEMKARLTVVHDIDDDLSTSAGSGDFQLTFSPAKRKYYHSDEESTSRLHTGESVSNIMERVPENKDDAGDIELVSYTAPLKDGNNRLSVPDQYSGVSQDSDNELLDLPDESPNMNRRLSASTLLMKHSIQEAYDLQDTVAGIKRQREATEAWYILMPDSKFRSVWDVAILLMLGWISVVLPLQIAFAELAATPWVFAIDISVDVLFGMDMVLTCFTATPGLDGVLIVDVRTLTRNYVCNGLFFIDLIAIIPFQHVFAALSSVKVFKFFKNFRFLRMMKFIRLRKLNEKFDQYETDPTCPTGCFRLIKIFTALAAFSHFMGCVFYAVGIDEAPNNWFPTATDNFDSKPLSTQYFWAVYWSVTTLTTVGYGDITPQNNGEVAIAIMTMLIGAISFSLITATVSSLYASTDQDMTEYRDKLTGACAFIKQNPLIPEDVGTRIMEILQNKWQRKYEGQEDNEKVDEIYKTLPPSFLKELVYHVNKKLHKKSDLLRAIGLEQGQESVLDLFTLFRRRDVVPKETICIEGEICKYISFIEHGTFVVVETKGLSNTVRTDNAGYPMAHWWLKLHPGDCIGLETFSSNGNINVVSVISTSFGVLRCIDIEKFRQHALWNETFERFARDRLKKIQELIDRQKATMTDSDSERAESPRLPPIGSTINIHEFSIPRFWRVMDIRKHVYRQNFFIKNELTMDNIVEMKIVDTNHETEVDVTVRWTMKNANSLRQNSMFKNNVTIRSESSMNSPRISGTPRRHNELPAFSIKESSFRKSSIASPRYSSPLSPISASSAEDDDIRGELLRTNMENLATQISHETASPIQVTLERTNTEDFASAIKSETPTLEMGRHVSTPVFDAEIESLALDTNVRSRSRGSMIVPVNKDSGEAV